MHSKTPIDSKSNDQNDFSLFFSFSFLSHTLYICMHSHTHTHQTRGPGACFPSLTFDFHSFTSLNSRALGGHVMAISWLCPDRLRTGLLSFPPIFKGLISSIPKAHSSTRTLQCTHMLSLTPLSLEERCAISSWNSFLSLSPPFLLCLRDRGKVCTCVGESPVSWVCLATTYVSIFSRKNDIHVDLTTSLFLHEGLLQ